MRRGDAAECSKSCKRSTPAVFFLAGMKTVMTGSVVVFPAQLGPRKPRICSFFFQAEDGIRDRDVTGVQTCALPICDNSWNTIAIVFQELSLVPQLSVAENIFLGRLPVRHGRVDWTAVHARARVLLDRLKVRLATDLQIGRASCRESVEYPVCTDTV